jgi:hypothetical protein
VRSECRVGRYTCRHSIRSDKRTPVIAAATAGRAGGITITKYIHITNPSGMKPQMLTATSLTQLQLERKARDGSSRNVGRRTMNFPERPNRCLSSRDCTRGFPRVRHIKNDPCSPGDANSHNGCEPVARTGRFDKSPSLGSFLANCRFPSGILRIQAARSGSGWKTGAVDTDASARRRRRRWCRRTRP